MSYTIATAFHNQTDFELMAELDWLLDQDQSKAICKACKAVSDELITRSRRRQYLENHFCFS